MSLVSGEWFPVRQYWKNKSYRGLWNMDDYGNLYRVKRWDVVGRGFCSTHIK